MHDALHRLMLLSEARASVSLDHDPDFGTHCVDVPAAPVGIEADMTPAQLRCAPVPDAECEGYPDCRHCPAWIEPTNRSRA